MVITTPLQLSSIDSIMDGLIVKAVAQTQTCEDLFLLKCYEPAPGESCTNPEMPTTWINGLGGYSCTEPAQYCKYYNTWIPYSDTCRYDCTVVSNTIVCPETPPPEETKQCPDGTTIPIDQVCPEKTNNPPIANAGPDLTANAGDLVVLQGSGTDADGDQLTYSWTQTAGPAVSLNNAGTPTPSFIAPSSGSAVGVSTTSGASIIPVALSSSGGTPMTFQLTVSDGRANSNPDSANVLVAAVSKTVCDQGSTVSIPGVTKKTYPISANTLKQAASQFKFPGKSASITDINSITSYPIGTYHCNLYVPIVIWTPQLTGSLSNAALQEWNRFLSDLMIHEQTHATKAEQIYKQWLPTVIGKTYKEAESYINQLRSQDQRAQKQFDAAGSPVLNTSIK